MTAFAMLVVSLFVGLICIQVESIVGKPPTMSAFPGFAASRTRSRLLPHPQTRKSSSLRPKMAQIDASDEDDNTNNENAKKNSDKNKIVVSTELDLPFSAEVAFDAYSDLPRQASWSPWLKSVEYVDPTTPEEDDGRPRTKWTMRYLGVGISWFSVSTKLERPRRIGWETYKGLKNFGEVEFEPLADDRSKIKLTLTFVVPRFAMLGRKAASAVVKDKMLKKSLNLFRDIVMENDMNCSSSPPAQSAELATSP